MNLQTATTRDVQRNFSKILDRLDEPVIVMRDSQPEAVLVDYWQYLEMKKGEEKRKDEEIFEMLKRIQARNAHITAEEVEKDVDETLKHVRSGARH